MFQILEFALRLLCVPSRMASRVFISCVFLDFNSMSCDVSCSHGLFLMLSVAECNRSWKFINNKKEVIQALNEMEDGVKDKKKKKKKPEV